VWEFGPITRVLACVAHHWKFAFDAALFPTVNEDQLALEYAFVPLLIAYRCAGMVCVNGQCEPVAQD